MTIDQLIALLASLGACLSAIATFLTVRQIAKQREASYKPELAFSRTFFEAGPDPLLKSPLPTRWVTNKQMLQSALPLTDLHIPLQNVGLGAAKNVIVHWSFPVEETVNRANSAAQRTLTPAYFSADEWGVSFKSESLGTGTSMWKNQQKVHMDFVLPASIEKEPTTVAIPHAYIQLCAAVLFLESKDKDVESRFELPALTAQVSFTDIGNRKHCASFKFDICIITLFGDGTSFDAYVDCTRNA